MNIKSFLKSADMSNSCDLLTLTLSIVILSDRPVSSIITIFISASDSFMNTSHFVVSRLSDNFENNNINLIKFRLTVLSSSSM